MLTRRNVSCVVHKLCDDFELCFPESPRIVLLAREKGGRGTQLRVLRFHPNAGAQKDTAVYAVSEQKKKDSVDQVRSSCWLCSILR